MAKVFLDTNIFIDVIHRKPEADVLTLLENHTIIISPLSVHIYCYIFKIDVLENDIKKLTHKFIIEELNTKIYQKAVVGPTNDLEDNIQLHSAVESNCDIFLTSDKKLLKMGYFGKTRISSEIKQMSI